MPEGKEFVKHEFDEGISIQEVIVAAAEKLAPLHPLPEAQQLLARMSKADQQQLETLKALGEPYVAKGKLEDVSKGLADLMKDMTHKATLKKSEPSDAYEAHAVLLTLKRKQQDSAAAIQRIGAEIGERQLADAAGKMAQAAEQDSKALAASLATLAVQLATAG